MSEWKGIESAPRDGKRILLWGPGVWIGYWDENAAQGDGKDDSPGWQIFRCDMDEWYSFCMDNPTHWMPLPEPPKE